MIIKENISLKTYNSYSVDTKTKYFAAVESLADLSQALDFAKTKKLKTTVLGGGYNTLFTQDYEGLIIKCEIKGREIVKENDDNVWIKLGSGEDWDSLVRWAVEQNYGGVENMVMVPSTIGGAVSQNIAAYGQNLMDVFEEATAVELVTGKEVHFDYDACKFTYRNSIFKHEARDKYILLSATIKLNKHPDKLETNYHERKGRYGSLEEELKSFATEPYTIKDVMNAVIRQRTKRLPSVDEYGTCGSVFENPVVSVTKYLELSKTVSELQVYPVEKLSYEIKDWSKVDGKTQVKIPIARLIDELGYRGKWFGNVGMSEKHALCLITNKKATGKEIKEFLDKVRDDIKKHYEIDLKPELSIY